MLFIVAIGLLLAFVVLMLRRTQMPPQLRSVIAVLFGFFAMALAISLCTMIVRRAMQLEAGAMPQGYLLASAAYSVLAGLLGGWVAGDIAPTGKQVLHGVALALLMVLLSLYGFLHPAAGQPQWYRLFLATLPPLAVVAGSGLPSRRLRI